jgi:hypothetical protein
LGELTIVKCNFGSVEDRVNMKMRDGIYEVWEKGRNNSTKPNFQWYIKSKFISKLIHECSDCGWVDIEHEYYSYLKNLIPNPQVQFVSGSPETIETLNRDFEILKSALVEYLKTIRSDMHIQEMDRITGLNSLSHLEIKSGANFKFVNFNYTNTIERYMNYHFIENQINIKYSVTNIHGQLADNNIIFGYGDESDKHYESIEELNNPAFLKHFKHFQYLMNNNYREIDEFVNSDPFDIFVLGLSCGLSDRVLLKYIFEHKKCNRIKIIHHEREDGSDDFMDVSQNISRYFSLNNRQSFRTRIICFDKKNKMPQLKKK